MLSDILPLGLGVALSPFPIIAIVLVLTSPRAEAAGPAFAAGFVAGLLALAAVVFALLDGSRLGEGRWGAGLRLAIGLALVALAIAKGLKRPRPGETPAMPGWMAALQDASPGAAFLTGAALGGLNPKNIAFAAAAAAGTAALAPRETIAAALAFIAIGSASVLLATLAHLVAGPASAAPLAVLRRFMTRYGSLLLAAIFLLLGIKLVLAGLSGLTG